MAGRVVCVMGRVLDQQDGLAVYAENLLRALLVQDPATEYVILLRTPARARLFAAYPNARALVLPAPRKIWWDQVAVPRAARSVRADILFNPKFSLPLASRRRGVFVLHGSDWYVNPGNYEWWDNLYIRAMLPVYCRRAARLLAISRTVVEDLARHAGIDRGKVTVSYAAPSPHFTPDPSPSRLVEFAERYRLPVRFILTVARAYHTGHGTRPEYPGGNLGGLLDGYRRYRALGGDLPMVVAGAAIEPYLRSRGYGDAALEGLHFTGFIPHREINLAYNLADFFVLTTLYESFALPLVEAMASGCPAIVPATGACPEVAGDAARAVDPRDPAAIGEAMLELAQAPERRARLRAAGLERVRRFTWPRTAELTLGVFDSLVPRPASPPAAGLAAGS